MTCERRWPPLHCYWARLGVLSPCYQVGLGLRSSPSTHRARLGRHRHGAGWAKLGYRKRKRKGSKDEQKSVLARLAYWRRYAVEKSRCQGKLGLQMAVVATEAVRVSTVVIDARASGDSPCLR